MYTDGQGFPLAQRVPLSAHSKEKESTYGRHLGLSREAKRAPRNKSGVLSFWNEALQ